jgi:hypothetical protein
MSVERVSIEKASRSGRFTPYLYQIGNWVDSIVGLQVMAKRKFQSNSQPLYWLIIMNHLWLNLYEMTT